DVFGSSANDVYIINNTQLWRWNGSAWSMKTMPMSASYGWANSPTDVWLNGAHYDGTFFVPLPRSPGRMIGSTNDMFTFSPLPSSGQGVIEYVGGYGGTMQMERTQIGPQSAWFGPAGHIFAAGGDGGLIVH